jgi:zinc/manganese transport system ATP-binding protein
MVTMRALDPAVSVTDLTISYDRHPAVHHLTLSLARGSLTAIVGPNGAGKSSLVKALAGLIRPSEGRIDWHGRLASDIAYLPQLTAIDEHFPMAVRDVVLMGHWRRAGAFAAIGGDGRERAERALAAVGLEGFGQRRFASLSAGQQQRALFARLMVADCPAILLDEPFSAIDSRTEEDLLALVHRWHQEGRTVIAVLHDLAQIRRHFPQTLLLARRLIAFGPTREILTEEALGAARGVSEAWDEHAAPCAGAA